MHFLPVGRVLWVSAGRKEGQSDAEIDTRLDGDVCCHAFRATGITAFLDNFGTLENAQNMGPRESPRTTKLYDRTDG